MATKIKSRNKFYNPNPKKQTDVGDCAVRSFCKATGDGWNTVYIELCELGMELCCMPNDKKAWKEYLKRKGFIEHKISNKKGSKRGTVQEFAEKNKQGTFVLNVASHLVTVVDGYFYDTWDCGHKSLYGYYEKPNK